MTRILGLGLILTLTIASALPPCAWTLLAEKSQSKSTTSVSKKKKEQKEIESAAIEKQDTADSQRFSQLVSSAQSYKDSPSNETYGQLWQNFESWMNHLAAKHISGTNTCKSCSTLQKAGLKIIDVVGSGGNIKIYSFSPQAISSSNKSSQTDTKVTLSPISRSSIDAVCLLIQALDVIQTPTSPSPGHHKTKRNRARLRVKKTAAMHVQTIPSIPPNVEIKQASLLIGSGNKGHFLAIIGQDCQSGRYWAQSFRHINTSWVEESSIWQQVPSFLLQAGQAKLRLTESSLVMTIGGRGSADNSNGVTYELAMPFVENHFALTRNEAADPAKGVALQLLLAIQGKRPDLAKIWLVDPELASIPGYLGLYNRSAGSPALKLITMSSPLCGGNRFRLITGTKDDLIIDVGKIKGQWLIKALFIAPADSLSREIGRIVPADNN